jgi:hypothetical protein
LFEKQEKGVDVETEREGLGEKEKLRERWRKTDLEERHVDLVVEV